MQIRLFDHVIFIDIFHPGIIKYHVYIIFDLLVFQHNLSGHRIFVILAHQLDPGDRCFDLMDPAFDIFPVFSLRILDLSDPLDHRLV